MFKSGTGKGKYINAEKVKFICLFSQHIRLGNMQRIHNHFHVRGKVTFAVYIVDPNTNYDNSQRASQFCLS